MSGSVDWGSVLVGVYLGFSVAWVILGRTENKEIAMLAKQIDRMQASQERQDERMSRLYDERQGLLIELAPYRTAKSERQLYFAIDRALLDDKERSQA